MKVEISSPISTRNRFAELDTRWGCSAGQWWHNLQPRDIFAAQPFFAGWHSSPMKWNHPFELHNIRQAGCLLITRYGFDEAPGQGNANLFDNHWQDVTTTAHAWV
jgi:hypothetical protein